ncbi:heat shock protein HSP20 family protein [Ceratobasidium sp. AG-Ba]|nr:heat shock protein HSP20 family protein [Ceratobasidium sp. AG-Ba]
MSLARNFFEFEPMLRLVQEPSNPHSSGQQSHPRQRQAHAEVFEEPKKYVIRAELPGVQKDNLDVHVGDDGRSVTIEGRVYRSTKGSTSGVPSPQAPQTEGNATQETIQGSEQAGAYEYRSTFSRTVWLPHAVDGSKASGKLVDGVLTLDIPKRDEPGRQKISLM